MLDMPLDDADIGNVWTMKTHDIRNVAARIQLAAEELVGSSDPRTRLLGERALKACEVICDICEDARRSHITRCNQSLSETVDVVADLARAMAKPGTVVHADCQSDAQLRRGGVALFRILANLTNNAVSALNDAGGGAVVLRTVRTDELFSVYVEDSGTGPARSPKRKSNGSGLGLLIATGLADRIGADIDCLTSGPEGTVFAVHLPAHMVTCCAAMQTLRMVQH